MTIFKLATTAVLSLGVICAPAFGADQNPYGGNQERPGIVNPGIVNYVEGAAYVDGRNLNAQSAGRVNLNAGEVLSTGTGKAELLLTPGVFLRLDDNSAVRMVSPDLAHTQVELVKGRAAVEVDEIYPQNNLEVVEAGIPTELVKTGYYEFNADKGTEMVFKGKAEVELGGGKDTQIKDHHEFTVAEGPAINTEKPASFNTNAAQDELYQWSVLRSQYLAEANHQIAGSYVGYASFYPGWYWNPYGWGYTFIGAGPYWSPFGFGFYSPGYFYGGGFYGRGFYGGGRVYGGGFAGRGFGGGGRR